MDEVEVDPVDPIAVGGSSFDSCPPASSLLGMAVGTCSAPSHSPLWSSPSEESAVGATEVVVLAEAEQPPPLSGPVRPTTLVEVLGDPNVVEVDDVVVGAVVVVVPSTDPIGDVVEVDVLLVVGAIVVDVVDPLAAVVEVVESTTVLDVVEVELVGELLATVVEVEVELDGIETPIDEAVKDIACWSGPGSAPAAAAAPVPVRKIAEAPAISVFVFIALPNIFYKYPFRKTQSSEFSARPT